MIILVKLNDPIQLDFKKGTLSINKVLCNASGENFLTTQKTETSIRTLRITQDVITALKRKEETRFHQKDTR